MTTIPPTAVPQLPPTAAAAAAPTVVIQQPSPQVLALLTGGTTVDVEVVPSDVQRAANQSAPPPPPAAENQQQRSNAANPESRQAEAARQELVRQSVILRTSAGDIPARVNIPVADGAQVSLEVVRTTSNQVTARIVAIDGQTIARERPAPVSPSQAEPAPTTGRPLPQAPVIPPGYAATPGGATALINLTPLSGLVLSAGSNPTASLPGQPGATGFQFEQGNEVGLRISRVQIGTTILSAPNSSGPIPTNTAPIQTGAAGQGPTATPPAPQGSQVASNASALANAPIGFSTPVQNAAPSGVADPIQVRSLSPLNPGTLATTTQPPGNTATSPAGQSAAEPGRGAQINQSPDAGSLRISGQGGLGTPPPAPPTLVQGPPPLATLTGTVTSVTPDGMPVIKTESGEIQLNTRANLPVGSAVTLEVTSAGARPLAPYSSATWGQFMPLQMPGSTWSSLGEALQMLQRADPQAAASLVSAIPDGGPRSAAAMIAFVQAMRTGDSRQWPGDAALRGLERVGARGAQLASQISGEVREMAGRAGADGGEWRTLPVPWNAEGKIERIALITRREDPEDDAEKKSPGKGSGTRFVVNLDLSRLGEMQLDGMFRKDARSFDLMIRTKERVSDEMARELPGVFAGIVSAMGMKGALTFQVVRKLPDPTAGPAGKDRSGVWA
ncbi:MAG: hypothetical protein KDE14_15535 [Rhodobacteraceae bacterium]|nr:hypothetical protein [Paracoccaceae bacterium]